MESRMHLFDEMKAKIGSTCEHRLRGSRRPSDTQRQEIVGVVVRKSLFGHEDYLFEFITGELAFVDECWFEVERYTERDLPAADGAAS